MDIEQLLDVALKSGASDLHLSVGVPAMIRIDGSIKRMNTPAFNASVVQQILDSIMNEQQRDDYQELLEIDFSFTAKQAIRFRVNAFHQSRGPAAVFRVIPSSVPTLTEIKAPEILQEIASLEHGLVLVTGSTGSGKSTTLAAIVNHINTHQQSHILTIEDPIEFVHQCKQSLITQRELQTHTRSFADALRSSLREDPNVILVGELRDLETIRLAITAAETGHLVLSTLHTISAAKTIDRIIDIFPAQEKQMVRTILAESLRAVIAQTLINKPGGGRIAAHEIMLSTPAICNLIRENKIAQIASVIQTNRDKGMQTLQQGLDLIKLDFD